MLLQTTCWVAFTNNLLGRLYKQLVGSPLQTTCWKDMQINLLLVQDILHFHCKTYEINPRTSHMNSWL